MRQQNNHILESWQINSDNWIDSIDNNEIPSRQQVTNKAIVETVKKYNPNKVLDLGCGEGWLTRELNNNQIKTIGIDGTEKLIANAQQKGGEFFCISYQEIINGKEIPLQPFEAVVINFALFEKDNTEDLLKSLHNKLTDKGLLFIQSLHPYNLFNDNQAYQSRWENDSWNGLEGNYIQPHRWYNRTLEDWINILVRSGYKIVEIKEPLNPNNKKPQSIIFVCSK